MVACLGNPELRSWSRATETTGLKKKLAATSRLFAKNKSETQERQHESEDSESDSDGQPLASRRIMESYRCQRYQRGIPQSVSGGKGRNGRLPSQ